MMLGNLSLNQIEKRTSIKIPKELRDYMEKNKQDNVSIPIKQGKWHCFDIPFSLVCGGKKMVEMVVKNLKPLEDKIKEPISISYTELKEGE